MYNYRLAWSSRRNFSRLQRSCSLSLSLTLSLSLHMYIHIYIQLSPRLEFAQEFFLVLREAVLFGHVDAREHELREVRDVGRSALRQRSQCLTKKRSVSICTFVQVKQVN